MKNNLLREIELVYKVTGDINQSKLNTSRLIYELLFKNWNPDTIGLFEEFKVLYLNRSNHLIGICSHSKGGIAGTFVDSRLIMATALKCAASGIILAHNHPSGNLKPSFQDIDLTERLKNCCEMFEITLLDHVIITDKDYYSFRDHDKLD